jgi:hypothetical protein
MLMTSVDDISMRFFDMGRATKGLVALLFFASYATSLHSQAIRIKLVDGKTGQPVAGACVGAMMAKDYQKQASIPMDKDGIASLRLTQKDNEVDVAVNTKLGCGGNGAINPAFKYADSLSIATYGDHPSCAFPESIPNARYNGVNILRQSRRLYGVSRSKRLLRGR